MKRRLKHLARSGGEVQLEDFQGKTHTGIVLMERHHRSKGTDNHYYFQREGDGATIRLISRGSHRAVATPRGLALRLRGGQRMAYISDGRLLPNQYTFENLREEINGTNNS